MKKILAILGTLFSVGGFTALLMAQSIILTNSRYTWHAPFTPYEARIMLIKVLGIIFLICGILDLIIYFVSKIYTQKTEIDPNSLQASVKMCQNCGLQVQKTTHICPKCRTEIK